MEYFIVPYLLWFVYVAAVFLYLFFKGTKQEFYRYCAFLFTGMTLFLLISTLYPNGHLLRPTEFPRHNIFTFAVQILYQADTPTNIFPSIHVFNSIAAHRALVNNLRLGHNRLIRGGSLVLMVSIILATMFLKQHSGPGRDGGYRAGHSDGSDRVPHGVLVLPGTDFQTQKTDGYLRKKFMKTSPGWGKSENADLPAGLLFDFYVLTLYFFWPAACTFCASSWAFNAAISASF